MSSEEDPQVDELRKKREERRKQHEEEERREAEERQRKEEERKQRKLERERKAKEREEQHAKELEEKAKKDQKDDERKKRREERERQRLEEERLEREAEEKKQKEREEKRRLQEEQEEEERKKRREREALRRSHDDLPARDRGEEARPDGRRKQRIEKLLNIIKTNNADAIDKIVADEDLKEEATKLLTENNDVVGDFFNKQDTIITILKYISTVHPEPQKLTDDQLEDLMTRMEFAKEAISGGIPSLWRTLLQPENRHYLAELFSLLQHDNPLLPPINVSCFWKSVEFLLYRRSYEISHFMLAQKDKVIPSFFKHLRDTNLMDILYKLVEKETAATPSYKDFDPKKEATVPGETLFWTDDIPDAIVAYVGRMEGDSEWSDVEIDNLSQFCCLVLEKFPECKLAQQLREASFCQALVARVFSFDLLPPPSSSAPHTARFAGEGSNGVNGKGVEGAGGHKTRFRHQSTLIALLSFLTHLLKFSANTSSYATDTIPPLVASLLYGSGGKGSNSEVAAVHIIKNWLLNKTPEFEFPIEHLGAKKSAKTFGVLRVKCLQLVKSLFIANFQCVDVTLRDIGVLHTCVDIFFLHVDNNIIHSLVEDIVKLFLVREASNLEVDTNAQNQTQITQHLLDDCYLVEKLVATLRTITLNKNQFSSFSPTKIDFDDPPRNGKRAREVAPAAPEKDKPFLPPAFVGHILNICKAITHASEKSVKVRHLVASCSGYQWGQTVMFHIGMRDSADMEWKKPFKKVDNSQDNSAANPVVD